MKLPYDDSDKNSILAYGKALIGKTIRRLKDEGLIFKHPKGKEGIGGIIETYFGIEKNNRSEPDFKKCGIELKTAPLDMHGKPKYPLSISMIDYDIIRDETWASASVKKKIAKILIVTYANESDYMDCKIINVFLWTPSKEDWLMFHYDWEAIRDKIIREGPDKLSESDTYMLVPRRKGSKGETRSLKRGNQTITAKSRCYALKRSFMDVMLAKETSRRKHEHYWMIHESTTAYGPDFVSRIMNRSKRYLGKNIIDIERELGIRYNPESKSYAANVVGTALGIKKDGVLAEEFRKAGISVKTVRCNPGLRPIYAMSLRGYNYMDIISENWDDSKIKEDVSKMLIIVMVLPVKGAHQTECLFDSIFLHTPEEEDLEMMRDDWTKIVTMIHDGKADQLDGYMGNIIQTRPKAKTGKDKIPAPGGHNLVKKGFFIRTQYIKKILDNNQKLKS